ncbi:MAG: hypothetical protein R3195_19365, partial [Gemmatimonadota bacterium]|nr:hypothetical protein [Gemmatimonadota bacterium]
MGYAIATERVGRWASRDEGWGTGVLRETERAGYGPQATDAESDAIPEDVEELGDAIVMMAAHIHAGTQRFLEMIARFHGLEGWVAGGYQSCAHWLA